MKENWIPEGIPIETGKQTSGEILGSAPERISDKEFSKWGIPEGIPWGISVVASWLIPEGTLAWTSVGS